MIYELHSERIPRPAFSGTAGLASESKKWPKFLTVEDSLQLAAGSFNNPG